MKIALLDDHASYNEAVAQAVQNSNPLYQVFCFSDPLVFFKALESGELFDVLICDLLMPKMGGVEIVERLNKRKRKQSPRVLVLSAIEDPVIIKKVLRHGAHGYLPKRYPMQEILHAISTCQKGEISIPDEFKQIIEKKSNDKETCNDYSIQLTKRQLEILTCLNNGMTNQEISDQLFIGIGTVKSHINSIFNIFNVNNRINCLREAKMLGFMVNQV
jgi:two-component system, NarL family, response regulator LiaR